MSPVTGAEFQAAFDQHKDAEPERVLPVGGTFFESSGAVHTTGGSARSDGPTRALVFMLVPKGSPLTVPA
jgi:hypothetical protein